MDTHPPTHRRGLHATVWPPTIRPRLGRVVRRFLNRPTREDIRTTVIDQRLPAPLERAVFDVLQMARLWRREQLDVARELATHFADGMAAGAAEAELLTGFGDRRRAAMLIRRAKRRGRPWWWHAWRKSLSAAACAAIGLAGLYALLTYRYYMFSPTIAHDYIAELNAPILATPEVQRAWPIYRQAIIALEPLPVALRDRWAMESTLDPLWSDGLAYLNRNREALALIRSASQRETLGAPIEADSARKLRVERAQRHPPEEPEQSPPPASAPEASLFGTEFPFTACAREISRLLRSDITAAIAEGDGARAADDLQTMFRVASHAGQDEFLFARLVEVAVEVQACEAVRSILATSPQVLSDDDLVKLAHAVAARSPVQERLQSALKRERIGFLDFVQRLYTDDGAGSGHVTAEGMARLHMLTGSFGENGPTDLDVILLPVGAGAGLNRRELVKLYDEVLELGLTEIATPIWNRIPEDSALTRVAELTRTSYSQFRSWPAQMLIPAFSHLVSTRVQVQTALESTMLVIALELYRREVGAYPQTLAELNTRWLPLIPTDPFDGHAIRYRLTGGRPIIYSVGTDGLDDGGRPNALNPRAAMQLPPVPPIAVNSPAYPDWIKTVGGDWVLFPPEITPVQPVPTRKPAGQ